MLERMRAALTGGRIASQAMLIPEVVELDEPACDRLEARVEELAGLASTWNASARPRCWSARRPRCWDKAIPRGW